MQGISCSPPEGREQGELYLRLQLVTGQCLSDGLGLGMAEMERGQFLFGLVVLIWPIPMGVVRGPTFTTGPMTSVPKFL